MTRYRIEMAKTVRDLVPHLPPELKRKAKAALRSIADDPFQAKELREELAGLRSYRIARARLIYHIRGSVVEVVAFGPRADIYQRAAVELSKALRERKSDTISRRFDPTPQRSAFYLCVRDG
jgi:mRNA-degrading endonuclease RelE of RelBE toxin-antitoxin system